MGQNVHYLKNLLDLAGYLVNIINSREIPQKFLITDICSVKSRLFCKVPLRLGTSLVFCLNKLKSKTYSLISFYKAKKNISLVVAHSRVRNAARFVKRQSVLFTNFLCFLVFLSLPKKFVYSGYHIRYSVNKLEVLEDVYLHSSTYKKNTHIY